MRAIVQAAVAGLLIRQGHTVTEPADSDALLLVTRHTEPTPPSS
ncbi:hypothetical protein ACF09I_18165 [Streptomyces sp. NPDC014940]